MKATKVSKKGLDLIKKYEGLSLRPYTCPSGLSTIGWGATYYEDGTRVKLTDPPITTERAEKLLSNILVPFEKFVDSVTRDDINQNQFDALVSFSYNCGTQNLKSSTLLKKVNLNPNDPSIAIEFKKWNRGNGKVLKGLVLRRDEESKLYFS